MRLAVVGAGIAGLATAYFALRADPALDVRVLEAGHAPGGKTRSSVHHGFLFDWGPNGFLTNVPETLDLALSLGLRSRLRPASDAAHRQYLYRDGGLRPLPVTVGAFQRSELLSWTGKLRVLSELFLGGRVRREESVHAFVARHFGIEAARLFAGPLVAGITAGDARELSLDALFPRLRLLEASHGSVLRGLAAARRSERAAGQRVDTVGRLTTFDAGMQTLTDALANALGARLRTGVRVVGLEERCRPGDRPFALRLETHGEVERLEVDAVALAVPAFVASSLLAPTAPAVSGALAGVRYADVVVAALGFDSSAVPAVLDGRGLLAPRGEGVRALAVQWTSSAFPHHAPHGKVALRVFGGGTLDPGLVGLDDEAIMAAARRDLARTLGIEAEPEAGLVVRWARGLPQYALGHADRIEVAYRELAMRWPRLALVGDYLSGIGLNDILFEARSAVTRLVGVPRI